MCLTVCHQVLDGHERHIVFIGKLNAPGARAIVPSSLVDSHSTPAGLKPASVIESIVAWVDRHASVHHLPAREVGKRGPGDSDRRLCAIGNRCANGRNWISGRTPVVTPRAASMVTGKTGAIGAGVVFIPADWRIKLFTAIFSDAQANNTATVANGQRHLLNGHRFLPGKSSRLRFHRSSSSAPYTASFTQRGQCIFNTFERRTKRGKSASDSW